MCTIIFLRGTVYKIRDVGKIQPETWILGTPHIGQDDTFYKMFIGLTAEKTNRLKVRPETPLFRDTTVGKRPLQTEELYIQDPIKKVVLTKSALPFFASGSYNTYGPTWGGVNEKLGVFSSAIRHEGRIQNYKCYGHISTHLLKSYENAAEAVTELVASFSDEKQFRGGLFLIKDQRNAYVVEHLPLGVSDERISVRKVRRDDAWTNIGLDLRFYWRSKLDINADYSVLHNFLRSVNRWAMARHARNIDRLVTKHSVIQEIWEPGKAGEYYNLLRRGELVDYQFDMTRNQEPGFYSFCTHWKRGKEPHYFKQSKWMMEWDGRTLDVTSGNPCSSPFSFRVNLSDYGQENLRFQSQATVQSMTQPSMMGQLGYS